MMSVWRFRLLVGLVVACAIAGIVLLADIGEGGLGHRPWLPIGIALAAMGAVGAIVATTVQATRTEDHDKRHTRPR